MVRAHAFWNMWNSKILNNEISSPPRKLLAHTGNIVPLDLKSAPSSKIYGMKSVFVRPEFTFTAFSLVYIISRPTESIQKLAVPQHPYGQGDDFQE